MENFLFTYKTKDQSITLKNIYKTVSEKVYQTIPHKTFVKALDFKQLHIKHFANL